MFYNLEMQELFSKLHQVSGSKSITTFIVALVQTEFNENPSIDFNTLQINKYVVMSYIIFVTWE